MTTAAIGFSLVCMISVSLISIISSGLYRREQALTSEAMSFVSFAPGILYGIGAAAILPLDFSGMLLGSLLVKNILYCLSFHFRYESLRKFGPFVGALMLGTQPIAIFFFGWSILGEAISSFQIVSVVLVALALLMLAKPSRTSTEPQVTLSTFAKYYLLPTVASTLAIIWDRFFLKGQIAVDEFFILDRLMLVPALIIVLFLLSRSQVGSLVRSIESSKILTRNWKSTLAIGLLFTLSVYAYNSALEVENAAVVGLFRNSAYPLAAFAGAFVFERKTSLREWVSFSIVVVAVVIGMF